MSGIYIPKMQMPKNCTVCDFMMNCDECEGHECYCTVLNRCIGYLPSSSPFLCDGVHLVHSDKRLDNCPLVSVPDHGELIDRDALRNVMFIGEQCLYSWDEIEDAIEYAPTIIPADGGKKEES